MEFLNVGKNTLYGLLRSEEIHAFKIGKVWKIPKKSVEEYINRRMKN
jgi:excisionase family DNA binding protein